MLICASVIDAQVLAWAWAWGLVWAWVCARPWDGAGEEASLDVEAGAGVGARTDSGACRGGMSQHVYAATWKQVQQRTCESIALAAAL